MQNFPKSKKLQTFTDFCPNSTLSTQNEGRVLETDRDNKGKNILDLNSSMEKRGSSKRDEKCQVCIGIDQPRDKPLTSRDVQRLDTESSLKSPSISPFAGSMVDSAEVEIPYKGDDKNPTVKKSHVHENLAMVSDQRKFFKREKSLFPHFGHVLRFASKHSYRRHQTSQIVSKPSLAKSPMYSNIDSCAQSIAEGQQAERSTRDLNTQSCSAKNCIHSQRKDNSLQTDSKGKLNSSGELHRQQQSSSVQADRGCWHTFLETDSKWFELGERKKRKKKKKKQSEEFGLDKITTPNWFPCSANDELYVSEEGDTCFSICQVQDNLFTSSDEQHLDTVSYLKSPSPAPFAGSSVDSAEDRSLYNREDKIPKKSAPATECEVSTSSK